MKDLFRKLTSRKLWAAVAGLVTGIALALGADASDIQIITGAVTAVVSAVSYIIVEGVRDHAEVAKRAAEAQAAVGEAIAVVTEITREETM